MYLGNYVDILLLNSMSRCHTYNNVYKVLYILSSLSASYIYFVEYNKERCFTCCKYKYTSSLKDPHILFGTGKY